MERAPRRPHPVVWKSLAGSKHCVVNGLQGVDDVYEIKKGVPRANGFPKDACFEMSKRFPRQIALADSISNIDRMVLVSNRLKELVEAKRPRSVEFLPVSIINHKGRLASSEYFVISPLEVVDCIDKIRSKLEWNHIDPTFISSCSHLELDIDTIDPDLLLFRPKHLESFTFVRADLADEIAAGGFEGIHFVPIEEFRV